MASSPHKACTISVNLGRGHRDLLSDCDGIISWGGAVGASVFVVVVGQLSPQAANRGPLGPPTLAVTMAVAVVWTGVS